MSAIELAPSAQSPDATAAFIFDAEAITVPEVPAGSVLRTALVNRLRAARSAVVTLAAPAGYGKTTVLAQWAGREERPLAWLSVGRDDDPVALRRNVAAALGRVVPIDPAILDSLESRRRSPATALRTLMSALSSLEQPARSRARRRAQAAIGRVRKDRRNARRAVSRRLDARAGRPYAAADSTGAPTAGGTAHGSRLG